MPLFRLKIPKQTAKPTERVIFLVIRISVYWHRINTQTLSSVELLAYPKNPLNNTAAVLFLHVNTQLRVKIVVSAFYWIYKNGSK